MTWPAGSCVGSCRDLRIGIHPGFRERESSVCCAGIHPGFIDNQSSVCCAGSSVPSLQDSLAPWCRWCLCWGTLRHRTSCSWKCHLSPQYLLMLSDFSFSEPWVTLQRAWCGQGKAPLKPSYEPGWGAPKTPACCSEDTRGICLLLNSWCAPAPLLGSAKT